VIEHADSPDPWDSVLVKWDTEDGEEEDHGYVSPWELLVSHGASSLAKHSSSNTKGMVVRNAAEVERMPWGGVYTCIDDDSDSPQSIAEKRGLDIELIVLLNKETLKGLTKYSKLLKGTKVQLPLKGYKYQRSGGTVINTTVDGTAELQFPKEDEIFWEGEWTEEKYKIAETVLTKLKKYRGSGPFRSPVDYEALHLDDYTKVITTPMDLYTVENRLKGERGEQKHTLPKDYYREVKLVFENAKLYNPEGSELHRKGVNCLNNFEDWWRQEKKAAERDEMLQRRKALEKASAYKKKQMMMVSQQMAAMGTPPMAIPPIATLGNPFASSQPAHPHIPNLTFTMPSALTPGATAGGAAAGGAAAGGAAAAGAMAAGAAAAGEGSDRKSTVTCGICGADGHNRRTCPQIYGSAAHNGAGYP